MKAFKKHYKKILVVIVLLVLGIQLFRCVFPPFEMTPGTITVQEDTGIELKVKYTPVIYEQVTHYGTHDEVKRYFGKYEFILTNNTSEDIGWGGAYRLQVKRGLKWKNVMQKKETFYTLEMRQLPANSSETGNLNLQYIYGKLPIGKYRVVKDVNPYDSPWGPRYDIAGEFRVWF